MGSDTQVDTIRDTVLDTLNRYDAMIRYSVTFKKSPKRQNDTPHRSSDLQISTKRRQTLALRAFMAHLTKALWKKCGQAPPNLTLKACFREVVAWLNMNPSDQENLNREIDFLPPNMPRDWYVQAIRGMISRRVGAWEKQQETVGGQSKLLAALEAKG